MNLTNEEIRIKIAESLGKFRIKPLKRTTRKGKDDPNGVRIWYCDEHHGGAATYAEIPNYPESLDACTEFEKTLLTEEDQTDYWVHLIMICGAEAREKKDINRIGTFYQITATPKQRCFAYLRTKKLIP
jgi:hypothetical protein